MRLRVLVAVLVLTVAGCGDSAETNEYVDAVNMAQSDFAESAAKLPESAAQEGSPREQARRLFDQLRTGVTKVTADLEAVEPPEEVAGLHSDLIADIGRFEQAIDRASAAVRDGGTRAILDAQAAFAEEITQIGARVSQTITEINRELQE